MNYEWIKLCIEIAAGVVILAFVGAAVEPRR